MLIAIDKIQPAKHVIRESMDEEKLQALIDSIQETGQTLPIKVRPAATNGHYEMIWGHRRLEALKRLGAQEIDALVEECDDTEALRQAIVENYVRDDGTEIEKGRALKQLYEQEIALHTRTSYEKVGALVGMKGERVGALIRLVKDSLIDYVNDHRECNLHNVGGLANKAEITRVLQDDEIRLRLIEQFGARTHTVVGEVAQAIRPLKRENRIAVLDKAEQERLVPIEIQNVAAALKQAENQNSEVARFAAIHTPGNAPNYTKQVRDRIHTIEQSEFEEERRQKKKSKEVQAYDKLVKDGIEHLRRLSNWIEEVGYEAIAQQKFSPEAARFFMGRFETLVKEYHQRFRVQLMTVGKERNHE